MSRMQVPNASPTRPKGFAFLFAKACVLALVLPACKEGDRSPDRTASTNRTADDASVISGLVTAEETYLKLAPRMNALSKGLLDLRLPGPGTEVIFAPAA